MRGAIQGYVVHGIRRLAVQAPYWAPPVVGGESHPLFCFGVGN
jgi:hypothetical protein